MTRAEIIAKIEALKPELAGFKVASLRLFGSSARDAAGPASDIDLVVAFQGAATFDAYMDLKFLLEDQLGRSVDLVTEQAIRSEIRATIYREAVRVA